MAVFGYNGKSNVVFKCPFGCSKKHEHYVGTYENALVYFTGSVEAAENNNHYGDLMNIIVAHQLNEKFNTKTSAELYDILYSAASTAKYWLPEEERKGKILKLLDEAKDLRLIFDEEMKADFSKEGAPQRAKKRLYRLNKFEESLRW